MTSRIRRLPPTLIDQIAAGEVVERPSSVVKELVENALDAGSTRVEIDLDGGGLARIVIVDDGCGMSREEAELAIERHATSKISAVDDLLAISSYGFRGEAIPSIASVSHLTLTTSDDDTGEGTRVVVDGGRLVTVEPTPRARGTTLAVLDLFANIPARLKFLRTAEGERRRVVQIVTAIALARPDVGFQLRTNGREVLDLPAEETHRDRILDAFGGLARLGEVVPFSSHEDGLRVSGYVSTETFPTRRNQHVYVQERPVSDRMIIRAIGRATADALRVGDRHPAVFLYLDLDPHLVDVNVHPAKTEVRFRTDTKVFEAVFHAIRSALLGATAEARAEPQDRSRPGLGGRLLTPSPRSSSLFLGATPGSPAGSGLSESTSPYQHLLVVEDPQRPGFPGGRYLGQVDDTWLLVDSGGTLLIVDQHTAHERVLFERTVDRLERDRLPSQGLLTPLVFQPTVTERSILEARCGELEAAGFGLTAMAGTDWGLTSAPEILRRDPLPILREILDDLDEEDPTAAASRLLQALAARLACRAAIMAGDDVRPPEAEKLLEDLALTREPHLCPHGRPVWIVLGSDELERRFGRK